MPLTEPELELLRWEAENWQTELCDIFRVATVDDVYGGSSETETVIAFAVSAMIQSGAAQEQLQFLGTRLENLQIFTVFLPAGTDVRVTDHLIVTTKGGIHLVVEAVMAPETDEIERRVIATREGSHLL